MSDSPSSNINSPNTRSKPERRQYSPQYAEQMQDEISLLDLYRVLVRGKKILLVTMAVVMALAVVYLILVPNVYQVTAKLLEPSADILVLTNRTVVNPNLDAKKSKALFVPEEIFEKYTIELRKDETWNLFVEANPDFFPEIKASDSPRESLQNPFVIAEDKDYPWPHILLEYDTHNNETSDQLLTQYLKFTRRQLTQQLIVLHKQNVKLTTAALEFKIKTSRAQKKIKREDSMVRLENDLAIAKKLNIKDNRMLTFQDKTSLTVVATNMNVPRYMRGSKVLAAELAALKNRGSDDAFINGLRGWQQEVKRLKMIQYLPDGFEPFVLDGTINKPAFPIKPKRKLVLVLAVVLGLFLGVFVVFFFEFAKKAGESDT